jgi:transposase InsO family protein
LKFNKYEPGDLVFSDQFNVNTPGRPLSGYGREGSDQSLHGGTLFTDAASNYVYVECQSQMGAGDTVFAKTRFEQLCWDIAGANIKGYHSDNGVYTAKDFRDDCVAKDQTQSFSGVGAKHQNAVAERNIQTICYWARHMMVHAAVHCLPTMLTTFVYGHLLFNMQSGYLIGLPTESQA